VWNELENKKAFDQKNASLNEQLAKTVRFDHCQRDRQNSGLRNVV
jgi:hypothetical protein